MSKTIEANRIHLLDDAGRVRAVMAASGDDGRPQLEFLDDKGFSRFVIGLGETDHAQIGFRLPDGNSTIGIGDSQGFGHGVAINDENGSPRMMLGIDEDGVPKIRVYDQRGNISRSLDFNYPAS